jgi:hypothetical protein
MDELLMHACDLFQGSRVIQVGSRIKIQFSKYHGIPHAGLGNRMQISPVLKYNDDYWASKVNQLQASPDKWS